VTNSRDKPFWLRYLPPVFREKLAGKINIFSAVANSAWIFLDKVLRAILGVVVGAWVARYLGPTDFGELSYCIAFIAIFQSLSRLGLDSIVVRNIAKNLHDSHITLGTLFLLKLLSGIICWISAIVIYGVFNSFEGQGIWIMGLIGLSIIFQASDVVDLWFQGNAENKRTVLAKIIVFLISNGLKVALILAYAPLMYFAIVIMIESALTALAFYISYLRFPSIDKWKGSNEMAKTLLLESWPYLISGISIMVYMRIDQLMIKSMLGQHALGIFAAVIPISNLWNMIPVTICSSIAPAMERKKLEGDLIFNSSLVRLFRIFWIMSVIIILVTFISSKFVIAIMYGSAYEAASSVLKIYALTSLPVFLGVGQMLWIINQEKSTLQLIQTTAGMIVSVGANLWLLPLYGIEGAAWSVVLAQVISALAINAIFCRPLFIMQMGIKIFPAKLKHQE